MFHVKHCAERVCGEAEVVAGGLAALVQAPVKELSSKLPAGDLRALAERTKTGQNLLRGGPCPQEVDPARTWRADRIERAKDLWE